MTTTYIPILRSPTLGPLPFPKTPSSVCPPDAVYHPLNVVTPVILPISRKETRSESLTSSGKSSPR